MCVQTGNIFWLTNLVQESLFDILKNSSHQEYQISLWLSQRLKCDLHNLVDFCLTTHSSRNNRILNLTDRIGSFPFHVSFIFYYKILIKNKECRCFLSDVERDEMLAIFDALVDTIFS